MVEFFQPQFSEASLRKQPEVTPGAGRKIEIIIGP